jgi:dimethylargininase
MLTAITRHISPSFGDCILTHLEREPIDVTLAARQHGAYVEALRSLGCRIVALPADPAFPDGVFVEDAAIVLDEVAIVTRPGDERRRDETASVAEALAPFRSLVRIEAPATIDGGDVLRVGRRIFVGRTPRTNAEGVQQFAAALEPHGYAVAPVAVRGCLHLKSACTRVADDLVIGHRAWVDPDALAGVTWMDVDAREPWAANQLLAAGTVVSPAGGPRTIERLRHRGLDVRAVDVTEIAKAEGGVTCCSLIFDA